jgi:SpoIIAA-like
MPVLPLSSDDATVIRELEDMPAGVIGFEASGTLKAEDYRDVVVPALERASASGEVRFVIVIPQFDGMSGGALWEDLKVGIDNLRAWKRIALVTDIEWMKHVTRLFGWMTPGELRQFPLARRADAIAWVAARYDTEQGSDDGARTGA